MLLCLGKKKKVLTENKTTQNRPKQHRRKKDLPEPARLKTPKKENPKEREKEKTPTNSRNEAANHKRQPLHQSLKGIQKAPRPPRPKAPAPPAATPPRRPPPPSPPPRACTGASRTLLPPCSVVWSVVHPTHSLGGFMELMVHVVQL